MTKIALVTGGSGGIGAAAALGLAQDGFDIWLHYHTNTAAAQATKTLIEATGQSCTLLCCDACDKAAVELCLDPLLANETPFALINNAGYARDTLFGLMSDDTWHSVLNVHLDGFFHFTRKIAPLMQRARQGRIVNIGSTSGQTGVAGQVNYSAAKAGLIGATKALAKELAPRNILINAVAPGFITTAMTTNLDLKKYTPFIPQGRAGTPEEVAACIRFLCSAGASYITGQVLSVTLPDGSQQHYTLLDAIAWHNPRQLLPIKRVDDAVQVAGHNVFPDRVATVLSQHADVAECSVRLMHPDEGDRLKAFIVPKAGVNRQSLHKSLRAFAQLQLTKPEQPLSYTFGEDLPRSLTGKPTTWKI